MRGTWRGQLTITRDGLGKTYAVLCMPLLCERNVRARREESLCSVCFDSCLISFDIPVKKTELVCCPREGVWETRSWIRERIRNSCGVHGEVQK